MRNVLHAAGIALLLLGSGCPQAPRLAEGEWQARLESPGGPLPFGLELRGSGDVLEAVVVNGHERIEVPRAVLHGGSLELSFPHYDASIVAGISADGRTLTGEWIKRAGPEAYSRLPFRAVAGQGPRFAVADGESDDGDLSREDGGSPSADLGGRWLVDFESDDDPAIAVLEQHPDGRLEGTVLTTVGDFRFLAGRVDGNRLRLSTFDGAHAFLFDARLSPDGTLTGDFWSRDSWHETWTAVRDDDAGLPDPYTLTAWVDDADLGAIRLVDREGRERTLEDADLWGRVTILELFGTWCPNCNDAAVWLEDLHERYADRGLSIVGLAFELTGDPARDLGQLDEYAGRHGIRFPLLLAGLADKAQASAAFPAVDRVRAYPTFVIFDAERRVRAVLTGFSGPATGGAYHRQSEQAEALIEQLLDESSS